MKNIQSLEGQIRRFSMIYVVLVLTAVILGAATLSHWYESSNESLRINAMVQDVEAMRGHLYRQMKELFDTTFLDDVNAQTQYVFYGDQIDAELKRLSERARGEDETEAIKELKRTYRDIHARTDAIISGPIPPEGRVLQRIFDTDIETGGLEAYEKAFLEVDRVFQLEQERLRDRLVFLRDVAPFLLLIPTCAAGVLLWTTRRFLRQAVMVPFKTLTAGTRVIAAGDFDHRLPLEGADEVRTVSRAINQMARDLGDSREALLKAERQATLGALVPVVAHNIRNPLASIRATAQVLEDEVQSPETREGLKGIMASTDRLERWTASLLSYLHPLEAHRQQVSINAVLKDLMLLVAPAFSRRGIALHSALPEYGVEAELDVDLFEQAIHGLLMNALEASPAEGAVIVELARRETQIEIGILDEGPGLAWEGRIPAPPKESITPIRSTKRTGTGLGIPFALKVSEVHDGGLRFLSRSPRGTRVVFWIPRS
jgi:signal transduction histidine kinase